jgi:hypothetical protein
MNRPALVIGENGICQAGGEQTSVVERAKREEEIFNRSLPLIDANEEGIQNSK